MSYRPTDRFENWFITSLQTDVNDTTTSFRLNKALNVNQCRLVIDPYDESKREIVKVTSVDGNLVYVERGDDNTAPEYHNEGTIVALHVIAADLNDLYADWAEVQVDIDDAIAAMQGQVDTMIEDAEQQIGAIVSDVEATAFLAAHPVGSTYWNETDSRNPGTVYGGTWVQLKGVVLGGKSDVVGSPFNVAAGTIIGADTHTLTVAQMPSHSHRFKTGGSLTASTIDGIAIMGATVFQGYGNPGTIIEATGGGGAHPNIQRTLVGYLWKRTA